MSGHDVADPSPDRGGDRPRSSGSGSDDEPGGRGPRDDGAKAEPPAEEDGPDQAAAEGWGLDSDPAHPTFDQDVLRNYELEVDPDEWAYINETAYLEEYIQGRLRVDDEVYEPVGVRFKGFRGSLYNCFRYDDQGNATARVCDRLSLKVSFNKYDPEGRFHGLKKLNFHSMNNDTSKLRERLAYFLFRRFGVPAPRAVHATLTVNGQSLGLYALVEQVDGRFTRMRFLDGGDGNLYKERWPTSSTDPEYFRSGLETNEDDPDVDVGPMVRFAEELQAATEDTIEDVLRRHTDFDALMRYLAVDRAIENWDGITAFRCQPEEDVPPLPPEVYEAQTPPLGWEVCQNKNFYWYQEDTAEGRLWLTAWDTDTSMPPYPNPFPPWTQVPDECPVIQSGRPPMCDPLIAALATTLRPHFVAAGRRFLEEVFNEEVVRTNVQAWSDQIRPYLAPSDFFATDPQFLFDRIAQYRAAFEAQLN